MAEAEAQEVKVEAPVVMKEKEQGPATQSIILTAIGSLLVLGAAWTASTILTLRENDVRMQAEINAVQKSAANVEGLAASISDLKADLRLLTSEVSRLREDVVEKKGHGK